MRGVLISVLVAMTLGLSPYNGGAIADEAYVCDGGRVAYVRFGELEAMKRKDPCIAAYYGAADGAVADGTPQDADRAIDRVDAPGPLPVVRTAGTKGVVATRKVAAPTLEALPQMAAPPRQAQLRKVASSGAAGGVAERVVAPPLAHPETDFRNVRVINAAPGESTVFRHLR